MTDKPRPMPRFKALGPLTEVPLDHAFTESLDEVMKDAQATSFEDWLFGDVHKLDAQARQLRTMVHNSKEFRAFIFNSHEDPEAEWTRLRAKCEQSGKAD